jgi:hypothetical protein
MLVNKLNLTFNKPQYPHNEGIGVRIYDNIFIFKNIIITITLIFLTKIFKSTYNTTFYVVFVGGHLPIKFIINNTKKK